MIMARSSYIFGTTALPDASYKRDKWSYTYLRYITTCPPSFSETDVDFYCCKILFQQTERQWKRFTSIFNWCVCCVQSLYSYRVSILVLQWAQLEKHLKQFLGSKRRLLLCLLNCGFTDQSTLREFYLLL